MRSNWDLPICNGQERLKKNGKKVHSTQKPEALLHRILLATSNKNDLVLDPFLGSGTTATVAKKLGRNYYGIEKDCFTGNFFVYFNMKILVFDKFSFF